MGNMATLFYVYANIAKRKQERVMLFCYDSVLTTASIIITRSAYPYVDVTEGSSRRFKRTLIWTDMYVDRVRELRDWLDEKFINDMCQAHRSFFDPFPNDLVTLANSFLQFDMVTDYPEEYVKAVHDYKNAPVTPIAQR